jgi:hypothetical protein
MLCRFVGIISLAAMLSLVPGCGKSAPVPVSQQKKAPKNSDFFDKIAKATDIRIKGNPNDDQVCSLAAEQKETLRKALETSYLGSKTEEWPVRGYLECDVAGGFMLILLSDVGQVLYQDDYWHGVDTDALMAMIKDCQAKSGGK